MSHVRPGRIRTKRTNRRPALKLSTLSTHEFSLWEGEIRSIVCPDCRVWRRVMGESTLKIRDHRDDRKGNMRCDGANQLVEIDIDLAEWGRQVVEAGATVKARRATKVVRRPKAMSAVPVGRMTPSAQSADTARRVYTLHRERCSICKRTGRDSARLCRDGLRLATTYLERLKEEPRRAALDEFDGRRRVRSERRAVAEARQRAAATWKHQQEQITVARGQLTKRSGTAVEERNNLSRRVPGATSVRGRPVPLEPVRVTTS